MSPSNNRESFSTTMSHLTRQTSPGDRRSGIVLLVSLGVLTLLSLIGIVFAVTMRQESSTAKSFSDDIKAKMLARSGVERAISALQLYDLSKPWSDPNAPWVYFGDQPRDGTPNPSCPIEEAIYPSLQDGANPYSGTQGRTYEDNDIYVLKILDCASMINLNARFLEVRTDEQDVLARILYNLGRAIDPLDPPIASYEEALAIINYRNSLPGGRFLYKEELKNTPGGIISDQDFEKLRDYVTCHSWTDPTTVRPASSVRRPPEGQYIFNRINYGSLVLEPRSPININTAAKPVLHAVIADLAGIYIDENIPRTIQSRWADLPPDDDWYAIGRVKRVTIDFSLAERIAEAITRYRRAYGAFKTWQQFNYFCDSLRDSVLDSEYNYTDSAGRRRNFQADLLKAHFNPNTNLNKFNPNALFYRPIDKFDVTNYSTEFCFSSMGYYEITSLGRITSRGRIMAEKKVHTVVKIFDVWRDTTQEQFATGLIRRTDGGWLGWDGDDRRRGRGNRERRRGSNRDRNSDTRYFATLELYPEPDIILPDHTESLPEQCFYDGQIMLATIQGRRGRGVGTGARFYLHFEDSLDADPADAAGDPTMYQDRSGPQIRSVLDHESLGGLLVDGAYSELEKCLAYRAAGNFPGINTVWERQWRWQRVLRVIRWRWRWLWWWSWRWVQVLVEHQKMQGTVAFWIKPAWDINISTRTHHLLSLSTTDGYNDEQTQVFYLVYVGQFHCQFEGRQEKKICAHHEADTFHAQKCSLKNWIPPARQWTHIAYEFDLGETPRAWNTYDVQALYINGERVSWDIIRYPNPPGGSLLDITRNNNIMRLGERGVRAAPSYEIPAAPSECTYDEVCIWDQKIGQSAIRNLYRAGRYYKGSDARYKSAIRDATYEYPGETVTLGTITWTEYVPESLRNANIRLKICQGDTVVFSSDNPAPTPDEGGRANSIMLRFSRPVHYEVEFLHGLSNPENTPLLETPILDDVTITIIHRPQFFTSFIE